MRKPITIAQELWEMAEHTNDKKLQFLLEFCGNLLEAAHFIGNYCNVDDLIKKAYCETKEYLGHFNSAKE